MTNHVWPGVFGFALMAAYWPGIAGAATTPRWDVAALLSIALLTAPRITLTPSHSTGLALIAWLLLTLTWSEGRLDGIDAAFTLTLVAIAFAVGSTLTDLQPLILGSALGIGISSVVAIAQYAGWQGFEVYDHGVGGLFFNRDRLAAAAALVAIGSVACPRLWWTLPLLLPSLILTQSRGAWLALVAGLLAMPAHSAIVMWGLRGVAAGGALIVTLMRLDDASLAQRPALWRDTVGGLNLFGHGLGSFWESFPAHAHWFDIAATGTRPEHPHNELLWMAYEGGTPAVVIFGAFVCCLWRASDHPLRAVLVALGTLALFAQPFHDPATVILGALCAGFLSGCGHRQRHTAFDRGMALRPWLAAGNGRGWPHRNV